MFLENTPLSEKGGMSGFFSGNYIIIPTHAYPLIANILVRRINGDVRNNQI